MAKYFVLSVVFLGITLSVCATGQSQPLITSVTPCPVLGPTTPGEFFIGTFTLTGQGFLGGNIS